MKYRFKCKTQNYKNPRRKSRWYYSAHKHGQRFYNKNIKSISTKAKIDKWYLIKLKDFCTITETITRVNRQPTEWKKIFAIHPSDEGLISGTHKYHRQIYRKKTMPSKSEQRIWTDTSQKKIFMQLTNIRKKAQKSWKIN